MITIKIKDKEVKKMMQTMHRRGQNMTSLMTLFYGKVHKEVIMNFRMQAATSDIFKHKPDNVRIPWKPLSEYSAKARGAKGIGSGGILQASGFLYASMGKVRIITPTSMTYGTPSGLSAIHHFGGEIKPKRAKYLALPYPGVKGRPREYQNTFFRGMTLYQTTAEGLKPLFFLKDKVTIPARPHITISEAALDSIQKLTFKYMTAGA